MIFSSHFHGIWIAWSRSGFEADNDFWGEGWMVSFMVNTSLQPAALHQMTQEQHIFLYLPCELGQCAGFHDILQWRFQSGASSLLLRGCSSQRGQSQPSTCWSVLGRGTEPRLALVLCHQCMNVCEWVKQKADRLCRVLSATSVWMGGNGRVTSVCLSL